ncbi:hypothetical protein ZOSMA_10G01460 [Zostera marina]|uniref:Tr-type G domain-containing protein n=1 Tax=Zostera marina TaxID=29655 RepID=A0A0K9Q5Q0_ZOSMR|nr:hypothetical protein ZOSMA_10G01460 [Zostera marina]
MKSSSILLKYGEHSINLIDSPGHIDFCSEVSTAARLSDGALVLVVSVEGVHIQTHAALRQAWIEKLTPCLVLNKIDRLITELKLSPMEAYMKLQRIIHDVNGIISGFKSVKYLSDVDLFITGSSTVGEEFVEEEDNEADTFQPQKGNVVFVCALDGWGFGIAQFAEMYASKLGASSTALNKGLWGLRYFNHKTKMIVGKKAIEASSGGKEHQPMFVQLVLKPKTNPPIPPPATKIFGFFAARFVSGTLPVSEALTIAISVPVLRNRVPQNRDRVPRNSRWVPRNRNRSYSVAGPKSQLLTVSHITLLEVDWPSVDTLAWRGDDRGCGIARRRGQVPF